ncbi:hypothetical protein X759_27910 [Mesorhizobium sp. LSHC420B00]|nr:hypothetical protein X759_27910 [Mesorhizobium sp. LSHC420B00]
MIYKKNHARFRPSILRQADGWKTKHYDRIHALKGSLNWDIRRGGHWRDGIAGVLDVKTGQQ